MCTSVRSFDIPRRVGAIGNDCFSKSVYLYQLRFRSSDSLAGIVGDRSLDEALEELGVTGSSSLFRIDVDGGEAELKFPGWVSIPGGEGDLHLTLVRGIEHRIYDICVTFNN
jgi:hypothetical protein